MSEEPRTDITADFLLSKPPKFIHRIDILPKYEKTLVNVTNLLITGSTGSGKTVLSKANLEHRLIRNPDMLALVLDFKNESAFWEKQNDPKLLKELEKWDEKPVRIKTLLILPFLATKMYEEVLEEGWNADGWVYVKYVTFDQNSLDSKDYSLLTRMSVGKSTGSIVYLIEEIIERLRSKRIPVTTESILEMAWKKIKGFEKRIKIKHELKKIAEIGFITAGTNEHSFNLFKLLKFAVANDIRVIQFAMGDMDEELQPLRSVFARKIIESALSIKRGNRITNRLLIVTMELQTYCKKFGAGYYASEHLLTGVFDALFSTGRQIGIQTLSDSQIPSRLPDNIWTNTKTTVAMRLEDTDEIFFLIKRKIDSDPYIRTSPPVVYNFIDESPFFGKDKASTNIVDLLMQFKVGHGLIILNRKAFWLKETTLMPCRTFHRRIGDSIFPNINRITREEIIEKIGIEKIDFSAWSVFQDEEDEIGDAVDMTRERLINAFKVTLGKEINKEWKRGDKKVWVREKLIFLSTCGLTQEEKAEVLQSSQGTVSRIEGELRSEGLIT